ncbi:hypothetical protein NM208_g3189 [Fusarium decemcellulare]|uniref:Uncharacterized protein n=1 Tax=Fusarium decemcellulare TaxID=57161 RepID=A0ACC1SPW9_9HYPO|nr:hypothetical protein NM208_g3189 [Fusarium decemcellulare]
MRNELETKLFSEFPDLYETLQYKQIECLDGWYDIIYRLSADIANLVSQSEDLDPKVYTVFQVKEKFGALRFYMFRIVDGETLTLSQNFRQWQNTPPGGNELDLKLAAVNRGQKARIVKPG